MLTPTAAFVLGVGAMWMVAVVVATIDKRVIIPIRKWRTKKKYNLIGEHYLTQEEHDRYVSITEKFQLDEFFFAHACFTNQRLKDRIYTPSKFAAHWTSIYAAYKASEQTMQKFGGV